MITILGIDPGYGTIGYGVVRFVNMEIYSRCSTVRQNRSRNTDAPALM